MLIKNINEELMEKDLLIILNNIGSKVNFNMDFLNLFMQRMGKDNKIIYPKVKFSDPIHLSAEQIKVFGIKETTIGKLLFNAYSLPEVYFQKIGFVKDTIDKNVYSSIHDNLILLLTNKDINSKEYCDTIDRFCWLGTSLTNFKGYTMDLDSLSVPENFKKDRDAKYKHLIENKSTPKDVAKVEEELVNKLKNIKKDTGLCKIISMGAKGNFDNNYKNLIIGRGLLPKDDGKVEILSTDLLSGNKTAEYVKLSNNSIKGIFGRSLKTAQGGYLTKLVAQGFSYLKISKVEDCGTTNYLKIKLTNKNIKNYLNRYIKLSQNGKLIELTFSNYKEYVDKDVFIRSPLFCKCKDGLCRTCYGSLILYNKMDRGLNSIIADLTSTIMNKSMKSFHDLTVKYFEVKINSYI